jgi:hypothetical protein
LIVVRREVLPLDERANLPALGARPDQEVHAEVARGINDVGEVVGFCGDWCWRDDGLTARAVLWRLE